MNQTKKQYECLLVLHNKLCNASVNELKEIGQQISDVLQYIERYNLFPIDLSDYSRKQIARMGEGGSEKLKLEVSKDLYVFLGKMMFTFEESNIINMGPYIKLLETNRTEYPFEQANDWGKEFAKMQYFDHKLFFFNINRRNICLPSKDAYQKYYNELRKDHIDINKYFDNEKELPSALYKEVDRILQENYKRCNEYINEHYSPIKRAFSTDHKNVRVYIQSRYENVYTVMINVYEGMDPGITIYPKIVDIMYRFSNVEAIEGILTNSTLTGIDNSDYSSISHIFSISGIHHELNRIFVRYSLNKDLTDYLAYILRGQQKRVSIISETEMEVDGDRYLLLFSKIPSIKDLQDLLKRERKKIRFIVFRSYPDDSVIEVLKKEDVSYIDMRYLGQSLINNQNGVMIHWFIKDRLDKIQLDDSYKELSIGDRLIKRLENCPKGKEGWKQYEDVGSVIFHYLFGNTFRNYTYEYQSSTSDGAQRRDLVVNNTYKDTTSFWQLVKSDYNTNLIIVDFKNYREKMNSDSFFIPTKYLNSVVGNFVIVFSRLGLDDTAKKVQQRLLSEKKLVMCLTDSDLINMINQKMNGQEPLNSLENIYYTMCKN